MLSTKGEEKPGAAECLESQVPWLPSQAFMMANSRDGPVLELLCQGFTVMGRRLVAVHTPDGLSTGWHDKSSVDIRRCFEARFFNGCLSSMKMFAQLLAASESSVTREGVFKTSYLTLTQSLDLANACLRKLEEDMGVTRATDLSKGVSPSVDWCPGERTLIRIEEPKAFSCPQAHTCAQLVVRLMVTCITCCGAAVRTLHPTYSLAFADHVAERWFMVALIGSTPDGLAGDALPMLAWALSCGCDEVASALVTVGVDVNVAAMDFLSPLGIAVAMDNVRMTRELLSAGALANATACTSGLSPLFFARSAGMVRLLHDHGARADMVTDKGISVVMPAIALAIATDCMDVVHTLLTLYGLAVLDAPSGKKGCPSVVEAAVGTGHVRLVQLVLKLGFRPPRRVPSREDLDVWTASPAARVMRHGVRTAMVERCLKLIEF